MDSRSPLALQDRDIFRVKIAPETGHFLESAGVPIGCGHFEVFAMGCRKILGQRGLVEGLARLGVEALLFQGLRVADKVGQPPLSVVHAGPQFTVEDGQ